MEVLFLFLEDMLNIRLQYIEEQFSNGRYDDCKEFKDFYCFKDFILVEEEFEFFFIFIFVVLFDLVDLRSCDG